MEKLQVKKMFLDFMLMEKLQQFLELILMFKLQMHVFFQKEQHILQMLVLQAQSIQQ
jgi:hypothetical protein